MAKLGDFKTPTGASGNLFDINSWIGLILGTIVLFVTFGLGQKVAQNLNGKAGGFLDTSIEQPWKTPLAQQPTKENARVVY